ncbi:hypothetical protein MG293_004509 [Ovis ammon polii]|uniref:Uncharacterized protein n=1 Tax=Ovis ammon polii TaxID=230172 RepID=A0AAD4YDR9_OVIAM|nr:hypothetical protein MG293_004509 [Ovis ammon polii]
MEDNWRKPAFQILHIVCLDAITDFIREEAWLAWDLRLQQRCSRMCQSATVSRSMSALIIGLENSEEASVEHENLVLLDVVKCASPAPLNAFMLDFSVFHSMPCIGFIHSTVNWQLTESHVRRKAKRFHDCSLGAYCMVEREVNIYYMTRQGLATPGSLRYNRSKEKATLKSPRVVQGRGLREVLRGKSVTNQTSGPKSKI